MQTRSRLRNTLRYSQQEAVASATMTGTSDNFLNAFAISLQASALQLGWLTALPQLAGAIMQIVSVWLGNHVPRKPLVVLTALAQSFVVAGMAFVALPVADIVPAGPVQLLIALAVGYYICINVVQPHWRAWMGGIVPRQRRGVFFAARSRLTMLTTLIIFIAGGLLLNASAESGNAWLGFAVLFGCAALGRFISSLLLWRMHDPEPDAGANAMRLRDSWLHIKESLRDPAFRRYSLFVASLQGAVAVSAPFFAVYMLRDLQFTYLQFSINSVASIATQFLLLRFWGRFSDRFGNHLVMVICAASIPLIPILWMLSEHPYYLIVVQIISGVFWSGFTLSTANYLYDIRPHQTNFALYAAIQSGTSALAVYIGGIFGGLLASRSSALAQWLLPDFNLPSELFVVFVATTLLRLAIVAYFLPKLEEPTLRKRPKLLQIIFRISRVNAVSGVSLDWTSVDKKPTRRAENDE
jgi:MFS family permease